LLVLAAVAALAVVAALPPVRPSRERYLPINQKALLGRWVSAEVEAKFTTTRGGGTAFLDLVNRRKASRPGVNPVINFTASYDFPDARTVRLTGPLAKVAVGHLGSDGTLRLTLVFKDLPPPPKRATGQDVRITGLPWPPGTTFTLRRAKEGAGRAGPPPAGRGRLPVRGEQTAPERP
jgi:hypothetical protein